MDKDTKEVLAQIYSAAVAAVDPYISVKNNLLLKNGLLVSGGRPITLSDINRIYVVGAGKAAYKMARAAEDVLGGLIVDSAVVTKDGHGGPLEHIELYEASHPLPDGRGVMAAARILEVVRAAGEDDLVICLLSGGASSLMVQPAPGITLADKQVVTGLMLASGADIGEINCVRKHLSSIKGGRLAEAAYPARVLSLIISDVHGDDIGVIASGPTAPDETTYLQAEEILRMRGVYSRVPEQARELLGNGASGRIPETPKPGTKIFERVNNLAVAFNKDALDRAAEVAGYLGYHTDIIDPGIKGEARVAATRLAEEALRYRDSGKPVPACLIVGGETTVTVKGNGRGGRNQEMALAFSIEAQGTAGISALFAGTDGTDGPTEAAGGFADGESVRKAAASGLSASEYLENNDSYSFLKSTDDLFITGPTGTNVMDIGIILVV